MPAGAPAPSLLSFTKQGQAHACWCARALSVDIHKAGPGACPLVRLHPLCCHSQSRARRMPAGAPAPSLLSFTKQGQAHARWCACTLSVVIHSATGSSACPLSRRARTVRLCSRGSGPRWAHAWKVTLAGVTRHAARMRRSGQAARMLAGTEEAQARRQPTPTLSSRAPCFLVCGSRNKVGIYTPTHPYTHMRTHTTYTSACMVACGQP